MGGLCWACTKCNLALTKSVLNLRGCNDVSLGKILLKGVALTDEVVVCASHMDRVLATLTHNRDMYRCATVFKGKRRGVEGSKINGIVS